MSKSPKLKHRQKIGIPRALLTHSLYPLFSTYLTDLGFEVILSGIDSDMELLPNAPFCYPTQILHGAVANLVKQEISLVLLPYIHKLKKGKKWRDSTFCPISLSAPYLISPIFENITILSPELDYSEGYAEDDGLIRMAHEKFNIPLDQCIQSYHKAVAHQNSLESQIVEKGTKTIANVVATGEIGIIVVGRSYDVYPPETSQSVPKKLVSMGVNVIPFDFLAPTSEADFSWYFANYVNEAMELVKNHDNLFLLYINNYSCTVDAFIQNTVRSEMKAKPYLLLELDAHVADAGTQTRLEAFLEIIRNYQQSKLEKEATDFQMSEVINDNGDAIVISSDGTRMDLKDPRVKVYMPCFSEYHTALLEKFFTHYGYHVGSTGDIKLEYPIEGFKHCSGKECIPLPIVLGQILNIVKNRKPGEIIGYMILTGGEPCVTCQYKQYMTEFLIKNKIRDVFFFGINKEYKFIGFINRDFIQYAPKMIVIGDLVDEMASSLQVVGQTGSMELFTQYWNEFLADFTTLQKSNREVDRFLQKVKTIPVKGQSKDYPRILLNGDFFVRYSPFFLKEFKKMYAQSGIIVKSSDLFELFVANIPFGSINAGPAFRDRYMAKMREKFRGKTTFWESITPGFYASQLLYKLMMQIERRLRKKFETTGLIFSQPSDLLNVVKLSETVYNPLIFGEAVLSVGKGLEIIEDNSYDALVLTGPQYCLPYKVAQGILKPIYLEHKKPLIVFDAEISAMSPNTKRLITANIEQIKRRFVKPHAVFSKESSPVEEKEAIK